MTRITKGVLLALLLSALGVPLWAGSYTANSCNQSDVNAVIHGPTHTAVAGDTIVIPAGTCTWNSGLSISAGITLTGTGNPNTGPSTFGSGTLNTIIKDNAGSGDSNALIGVQSLSYGQTFTLSLLDIEPVSASTPLTSPIQISGTCSSSGCPSIRIDNIGFGLTTPWSNGGNGNPSSWLIRTDNVFGVIDHCTEPTGSQTAFVNANLSSYLGVGGNGDNSWAQPDTFGGANVLYMENNNLYLNTTMTDCDRNPAGGGLGGCRIAGRFNQITLNGAFSTLAVHGLDTTGRMRGGRQQELYENTITCISSGGCSSGGVAFRGGTGYDWGNTFRTSSGSWFTTLDTATVYRTVFASGQGVGACGGSGVMDTNDGVVYYSGTITSSSGGYPNSSAMTDTSKSWTTNQFTPTGAPYSVYDVTQGFWMEIASNTSNSLTTTGPISEGQYHFNSGDSYQILRATVCSDQGGRGQGNYISGNPSGPTNEALDPMYGWSYSVTGALSFPSTLGTDTGRIIANRDYYIETTNQAAQSSPTSPFNGTSRVGHGTLANRPTTCTAGPGGNTPGVGYWATDQGNWDQSGLGGQGQLFVCTAPNTWTLHYTPYTYPHPLITGTGNQVTGNNPPPPPGPPGPPTSLQATAK